MGPARAQVSVHTQTKGTAMSDSDSRKEHDQRGDGSSPPEEESRRSGNRRDFIKKVGDYTLAFVVVSALGAGAQSASADPTCGLVPHNSPDTNLHTTDSTCGGTVASTDEACGDCDDHHDKDQNCAVNMGGTLDTDQMCGHVHFMGMSHDQVCGQANPAMPGNVYADAGCGIHSTSYHPNPIQDNDQAAGQMVDGAVHADRNCTTMSSDQTCGTNQPAYGSSPDEHCGRTPYDPDESCGTSGNGNNAYDRDQSCGQAGPGGAPPYDADQGCGSGASSWGMGDFDTDNACAATPQYDHDQLCASQAETDIDQSCSKNPANWDTDNSCKVGLFNFDSYDTTCNQTPPTGGPRETDGP